MAANNRDAMSRRSNTDRKQKSLLLHIAIQRLPGALLEPPSSGLNLAACLNPVARKLIRERSRSHKKIL